MTASEPPTAAKIVPSASVTSRTSPRGGEVGLPWPAIGVIEWLLGESTARVPAHPKNPRHVTRARRIHAQWPARLSPPAAYAEAAPHNPDPQRVPWNLAV